MMGMEAMGGIGSLIGSIGGFMNQRQANKLSSAQLALGMRNMALQEMLANRAYKLSTAGRENDEGRVYFDGSKWVEVLSPRGEQLRGQDDQARRAQLSDLERSVREQGRSEGQRMQAGQMADSAARRIQSGANAGPSRAGLEGMLAERYLSETMDPLNKFEGAVNTMDLRGGVANAQPLIADIKKLGGAGARASLARARVDASQLHPAMRNAYGEQDRGDYTNAIKVAQGVPGAAAPPNSGADAQLAAAAAQSAALAPQGLGVGSAAIARGNAGLDEGFKNAIGNIPQYGAIFGGAATGLSDLLGRRKQTSAF